MTLVLALLLFCFGACRTAKEGSPIPGVATGAPMRAEGANVVRRTLAETRAALAASYRLAPDRRLLDSIAYLDFRMTGQSPGQVSARFADGAWRVEYRGRDVGTLAELPDFEEGERLLGAWAERLLKEHPMSRASQESSATEPGLLFEDLAVDTLAKAETAWADAEHRADAVHLASSALASLAFQVVDSMQTADTLFGRAWGLVALLAAK